MDRAAILLRFEQWLDAAMAGEDPPQGIPAEILAPNHVGYETDAEPAPTDWYTMWAAMTALTQEVKLQSRTFRQTSETLAGVGEALAGVKEVVADAAERRGHKELLGALLEIRERLLRGLEATRGSEAVRSREELRPRWWDRIWRDRRRRMQHALDLVCALEEGYRMGLSYLDDVLFQLQVQPIECAGHSFDPRRMHAVDVEETDGAEEGTVLSVYRMGYEWNGELYRPAQVRVARRPGSR
jgi:hypothetical protein